MSTKPFIYKVVSDNAEVASVFNKAVRSGVIGFDTESNGKDWWSWNQNPQSKLAGITIGIPDEFNYYIPVNQARYYPDDQNANPSLVKAGLQKLVTAKVHLKGAHLKHDWHVIDRTMDVDLSPNPFTDILLNSHLWRINSLHNAKLLGDQVRSDASLYEQIMYMWKKEAGFKKDYFNYCNFPIDVIGPYAAMDGLIPLEVDEELHRAKGFYELFGPYSEIEHNMARHLFAAEKHGIKVDIPYLEQLKEQFEKDIEYTKTLIRVWVGNLDFNPGSPQQMQKFLYEDLKLPVQYNRKKSTDPLTGRIVVERRVTTDKMAMMMLQKMHPVIAEIQKLRKIEKLYGTYIMGILENYNPYTSRVHTTFNQFVENTDSLRTGRLSSSDPLNFENIPHNDTVIRRAFIPDNEFDFADYSGQEIRLYTFYSREPKLLRAFANGEDVHSRTTEAVFRIPYEQVARERKTVKDIEQKREIAKRIFFGSLYGAKGTRIAEILAEFGYGYDVKEGERLWNNLMTNYPGFPQYMTNVDNRLKQRGYVQDVLGRRYIPKEGSANYPVANYLIQGTAGGMLKIVTHKIAQEFGNDIFANFIHDEIVFDRLPDRKMMVRIKEIMEEWPMLDIPMNVDLSYATGSWENKKEIKAQDLEAWWKEPLV